MENAGRVFKMRLIHYLKEYSHKMVSDDFDEGIENVKKNIHVECKPFLRASKGYSLYRGMYHKGAFGKFKIRKDRKPLDTPADVHKEFDKIFTKNFGWPARSSGLLTTGDKTVANTYGQNYQVFPIGKFRFLWSDNVHDLYGRYVEFMTQQGLSYAGGGDWKYFKDVNLKLVKSDDIYLSKEELVKHQKVVFKKLSDLIKKEYSNKNLDKAIESRNEIMIDCKEYYALQEVYVRPSDFK